MSVTAAQCEQAGAQARAAAAAYEEAFTATVPPPVIAANRAQLMSLTATNFLGQNTPAIAATEAHYGQMWAQDAAAMYGYAAASAAATQLTPFTAPKQTAHPGADAGQSAAVAQATGTAAGNGAQTAMSGSMSATPQALQGLAAPLQAVAPAQDMLPSILPGSLVGLLGLLTPYTASIGTVNLATRLASQARSELTAETVQRIAVATGADELEPAAPGSPMTLVGSTAATDSGGGAVNAGLGRAPAVGSMSVPQTWTAAAPPPPVRTVTEVQTAAAGLSATPSIAVGDGQEILLSEMAIAGMAGRAMTVSGGRGSKKTYTITVTENPPEAK
jgi:PPE-repeat protein